MMMRRDGFFFTDDVTLDTIDRFCMPPAGGEGAFLAADLHRLEMEYIRSN
jgi:hypothetical protein